MTLDDLRTGVGAEWGVSRWFDLGSARIDSFGVCLTGSAAGFPAAAIPDTALRPWLVLSLLAAMGRDALPPIDGSGMAVNYGFDSVRFGDSLETASRVRGRFRLDALTPRGRGRWLLHWGVTVEAEEALEVVLEANWLSLRDIDASVAPELAT